MTDYLMWSKIKKKKKGNEPTAPCQQFNKKKKKHWEIN